MAVMKFIEIDGGVGAVFSDEALAILKAKLGDDLRLTVTEGGEVMLSAHAPGREARLERGRAFIEKYRPTFEALAK
jgi:hypothetical protein